MLGAIIGDTVGSIYEFRNTKDYDFEFLSRECEFTDDSVMTVAVARWLLDDSSHSFEKLEYELVSFGDLFPHPKGGYGGGFKSWLFRPELLYTYDSTHGEKPYESPTGRHPYGSYGNGSAMRVSAVGWFFDTLEKTVGIAGRSAAITHNHPEGIKGAQATAAAVFLARTGKSKKEIREYIEEAFGYDLHQSWEYWHAHYGWEDSCQGTVPQALIAFLESTSFEDAIRKAVSLGGDSDTLACITGGISEAFYGGVPADIAKKVMTKLPRAFKITLDDLARSTSYGKVYKR